MRQHRSPQRLARRPGGRPFVVSQRTAHATQRRERRERERERQHASHRLAHDARGVHPCCSVCCSVRRPSDDDRAPSESARGVDAARAGRRLPNACGVRTRAAALPAIARVGQRRRGWRGHAWRPVLDCFRARRRVPLAMIGSFLGTSTPLLQPPRNGSFWGATGLGAGGIVKGVKAETPILTNRIRSQKKPSFVTNFRGFFGVGAGGLQRASFPFTPFTRGLGPRRVDTVLLRVLRVKPPFLPIGSDLKKPLFCLELEGFSGVEQEGPGGPHFPLHP